MFSPDKRRVLESIDILNAVKQITPRGARIITFCFPHELAVRYYALRPLVYSFKDGAMFAYSNYEELLKWYNKAKEFEYLNEQIRKLQDSKLKKDLLFKFSRKLKAQYLLMCRSQIPDLRIFSDSEIVHYNKLYLLIRID